MNTLQELQQELKALSDKVDKALNNEQPQQAWEKYPTFESCLPSGKLSYNPSYADGEICKLYDSFGFPTEALAKYARAVMILSTVARKWNEGVEIYPSEAWFPAQSNGEIKPYGWLTCNFEIRSTPFYFHSEELCKKSIELFPEEWKEFFNAKGQPSPSSTEG